MLLSDPLGDMLARIRNAGLRQMQFATSPSSSFRKAVLDVLKKEGYILGYTESEVKAGISELKIELKYHEGRPVIQQMKRVSKPGRRVYSKIQELPTIFNGLGISIISTPKGVMSDQEARKQNVGGEVLCSVY